jgi:pentose-5-phosphate-3-epimerase
MGFKDVKRELIAALLENRYRCVARAAIETKNLVHTGEVEVEFVALLVMGSRGSEHSSFPHQSAKDIDVHLLVTSGWYIKFFFVGSLASLISVHRTGMP